MGRLQISWKQPYIEFKPKKSFANRLSGCVLRLRTSSLGWFRLIFENPWSFWRRVNSWMETGRILSKRALEREKYPLSNGWFICPNGTRYSCITPFSNSREKIHLIGQLLDQSDFTQLDRPDSPLSNTEKIRSLSPSVVELFKKWPSFFFFEMGNSLNSVLRIV